MAKLLIVDDEPQICAAFGHILKGVGHQCTHAANASEARDALQSNLVELILCDISMPGESGIDFARYVLNEYKSVAIVMVTAVDDSKVAEDALELGVYGYLIKPIGRNELQISVSNALRRRDLELRHRDYENQLESAIKEQTKELRLSQEETIQRLSTAVEFRDNETAEHNQRMSHYCGLIARQLGMSEERCEQIRLASVLHDVGKIGVSDLILFKPGKLTDEEFEQIKTHPEMGHRILSGTSSPLLELGAIVALTHHERYDGTGYPQQLAGEAIPIEGRIAAVADAFDALSSNRPYRDAWPIQKTVDLLIRDKGSHFDPLLVDAFLESFDKVLEIKKRFDDSSSGLSEPS